MKDKLTIIIAFLVGLGLGAGGMLLVRAPSNSETCSGSHGASHKIIIRNGKADHPNISAHLCDTITFTNQDTTIREIAFGTHEHHVPYDGIAERVLSRNQSLTITLNQAGTFRWHDHLHDEIQGDFTVKN